MSLSFRFTHDVVLLYAHPSMHKLAKSIADCCHIVRSRANSESFTPSSVSLRSSSSSSFNNLAEDCLMSETLGYDSESAQPNAAAKRDKTLKFSLGDVSTESASSDTPSEKGTALNIQDNVTTPLLPDITGFKEKAMSDGESLTSAQNGPPILPDIRGFKANGEPNISIAKSPGVLPDNMRDEGENSASFQPVQSRDKKPNALKHIKKSSGVSRNNSADKYLEKKIINADILDPRPSRRVEFRDTIKWNKFADGYPNLFIEDVKYMAGKDVIFIGSFHSTEIIFEQLSVLYAFPRYLAGSFHFILPYFPTGTMERVDTEGQIATAKTLATLLSSIPLSAQGPAQIIIYDIHALQERFYFSDNVIPRLETAIPLLQRVLSSHPQKHALSLAFPDDGAYKRFHSYFPEDDRLIICAKKRVEGNKRVVTIKDGNPNQKHVVIIDDLVQSGGTLIECAKVLIQNGAKSVSAYVTHPVFPNQSWRNFISCDPPFANFWITNSIPHAEEICRNRPFKLLSLSDIIAENLLGFDLRPV